MVLVEGRRNKEINRMRREEVRFSCRLYLVVFQFLLSFSEFIKSHLLNPQQKKLKTPNKCCTTWERIAGKMYCRPWSHMQSWASNKNIEWSLKYIVPLAEWTSWKWKCWNNGIMEITEGCWGLTFVAITLDILLFVSKGDNYWWQL